MTRRFIKDCARRPGEWRLATFAVAALLLVPGAARAQEFVMKFSTQTLNDMQHEYINLYKPALEKATNGRIRVDIYAGAQLGNQQRQIEGLRVGTIEAAVGPAELFAGADPRFQALAMGGIWKDRAQARRAASLPQLRKAVFDIAAQRQMVGLSVTVYDMQSFVFKTPVTKIQDFSGKRIRVIASEAEQVSVASLGGAPVPMSFGEILPALQQGTIDGVGSVLGVWAALRYYEISPYMLDSQFWALIPVAFVSKVWFDRLPPDLKKAVLDAGTSIEPELEKWQVAKIEADRKLWEEKGGKIAKLSPAEQEEATKRIAAAIQPVLAKNPPVKEFYETLQKAAATVN
jgi:TRAP-type C4-dicarboxylate transport system substrate-binding protein